MVIKVLLEDRQGECLFGSTRKLTHGPTKLTMKSKEPLPIIHGTAITTRAFDSNYFSSFTKGVSFPNRKSYLKVKG